MSLLKSLTNAFLCRFPLVPLADRVGRLRLDRFIELAWRLARADQMRRLHPAEICQAERVFGPLFPFEDVRVYENSPFASFLVSLSNRVHLSQEKGLGVTVFNTIHFSIDFEPHNADMPWLIHELTHVWQYRNHGPRYLVEALQAQAKLGHAAYDIQEGLSKNWPWERFNPEQQADLARAFYKALAQNKNTDPFQPYFGILHNSNQV